MRKASRRIETHCELEIGVSMPAATHYNASRCRSVAARVAARGSDGTCPRRATAGAGMAQRRLRAPAGGLLCRDIMGVQHSGGSRRRCCPVSVTCNSLLWVDHRLG